MKTKEGWVNQMIKVTHWDNTHSSTLEQLSLLAVHSILIDNDPQFKELKAVIENYNEEVRSSTNTRSGLNHASFRGKYVASLYKMLSEICMMKNSETQLKCLRDVYKWSKDYEFEKKDRPITATTRGTRPTTAKTRPTSGISMVVGGMNAARMRYDRNAVNQIQQLNREINDADYENMMEEGNMSNNHVKLRGTTETINQGADYRQGSRTVHSQYEVPNKRLKEFKRKCIDLEDQTLQVKKIEKDKKPKPQEKKVQEKKVQPIKIEPINDGRQLLPDQIPPVPAEQQPPEAVGEDQGPALGEEQEAPLDGDGGDDLEVIDIEEPVDKLAPRIKAYTHTQVPLEHDALIAQADREQKGYHKMTKATRDEHQLLQMEHKWAKAKSRWDQQESRRRQSTRVDNRQRNQSAVAPRKIQITNNFVDVSNPAVAFEQKRDQPNKFFKLQDTIYNTITERVKYNNVNNIKFTPSDEFQPVPPNGKFDRTKCLSAKTTSVTKPKRFTDILLAAQDKVQNEMDEQVMRIKDRLAKNKVACEFDKIEAAIGMTIDHEVREGRPMESITGRQLPSNPFFKVAKKKKKKKKK